jgi:hypothetical protein
MDEDAPPEAERSKPSQVPSWLMLGFALGALSVLALPKRAEVEQAAAPSPAPAARPAKPAPAGIPTIEAVFTEWDRFAVWSEGTTEVALWSSETSSFSDCYEVRRIGDAYYFRSIPSLTRPVLTHGVAPNSPLEFTETLQQRQEWLGEVRTENWKQISQGAHDAMAPVPQAQAPK